eukprot:9481922-Pyramimonas_sp.AAC.1
MFRALDLLAPWNSNDVSGVEFSTVQLFGKTCVERPSPPRYASGSGFAHTLEFPGCLRGRGFYGVRVGQSLC